MTALMAMLAMVAVVNRPVVSMFSQPGDSDVVSQARLGDTVQVLEASAEWLKVETPDGYRGWIAGNTLVERSEAYTGRAVVTSLFAHIYREQSITRHAPLLTVPFEVRLQVRELPEEERWLEVTLPDERVGWIQRGDVALDPQPLDPSSMLAVSRRFLGLPYTWGGTSSFGYDCSGFTQMLLRQRGILIPRDAHQQEAWSGVTPVEKANLEPGDLLFFGPAQNKITHTGLYLGSGEFIHATAHVKPFVQISRLDEEYWTGRYQSARRVK